MFVASPHGSPEVQEIPGSQGPSKVHSRIRPYTVRRKFASYYAHIMNNAPAGTTEYAPFLLDKLNSFESSNVQMPDDVRAVIDILRAQTQSLLGIPLDPRTYENGLKHFSQIGGVMKWYHTYVAKPIREGKMNWNGTRIQ